MKKNIALLVVGVAILAGAYFTYKTLTDKQSELNTQEQQKESTSPTIQEQVASGEFGLWIDDMNTEYVGFDFDDRSGAWYFTNPVEAKEMLNISSAGKINKYSCISIQGKATITYSNLKLGSDFGGEGLNTIKLVKVNNIERPATCNKYDP